MHRLSKWRDHTNLDQYRTPPSPYGGSLTPVVWPKADPREVEWDIFGVQGPSWPRLQAPAGEAAAAPRRRLTVFESNAAVSYDMKHRPRLGRLH
jgi:hypothetical protein